MTQVPPVAVAPVPGSVSSYWSPLGVVVIAMGRRAYRTIEIAESLSTSQGVSWCAGIMAGGTDFRRVAGMLVLAGALGCGGAATTAGGDGSVAGHTGGDSGLPGD